ncbi:uncharacterized protein LOC130412876 [Triplophysa dalaica]|uniref:uncharacterized protein LOC130412876 n=1 Tax=Triplophysa dalaica TaxID=1582913 RepID=UPI0024DFCF6C|nr:uncharacterized protein LOC130412876 [Triplophysa dalaica]
MAEGEEVRSIMKGVVNLAFQEETEVGMHNSTLAAKCQNVELPAAATVREFMNDDEKNLYEKLSEMLQEEDTSTVIDLPGTVMSAHDVEEAEPSGEWKDQPRAEQLERRTEVIPHYIQQLRKHVQKDMIPVGRPAMAQEDHLEKGMNEEKVWGRKKRVMSFLRGNSKIRNINKEDEVLQDRLYDAFQRTQTRLLNSLRQHQAEVIDQYGDIIEETGSTDMLGIGTDLRWEIEWTKTPQPIEVRVLCLRAVREKLPKGLYSLTVSLQTEVGGRTLRWSHLQEQPWTGSTEPVQHGGQYCDTDLNINQSLYMIGVSGFMWH